MNNPNVDPETGIHYGVISVNELKTDWFYDYCTPVFRCEECEYNPANNDDYPDHCEGCENCYNVIIEKGVHLELTEDNEVWVFKSPFTTTCRPCSPCAPNAGSVEEQDEYGIETYCPPAEWLREPEKFNIKKR